jgi:hypothetical protein
MGDIANGSGPSTSMGLGGGRLDALGVQGAKIGKAIKSFDDAYVYFFDPCLCDSHHGFVDGGSTCRMSACPNLLQIFCRRLRGRVCGMGVRTREWSF